MAIDVLQNDFPSFDNRIRTLKNLTLELLPNERDRKLTRLHLQERRKIISPYLPTLGVEIETYNIHQPDKALPIELIEKVEQGGIRRDETDSFPSKGKEGKWEVAFEPAESHVLLSRELQELIRRGLVRPHIRRQYHGENVHPLSDYYPVHVTVGRIQRDFPQQMRRKDIIRIIGEKYFERELRTTLSDWIEDPSNPDSGWKRQYQHSDCFIFARLLDATLYSTSPERIASPFSNWTDGDHLKGYAEKGFAGVKEREPQYGGRGMDALEIRTPEMWGEQSFQGFVRCLASVEAIGATLIAYQKMPMSIRDEVINLEKKGEFIEARQRVSLWFDSNKDSLNPHDKELALLWWNLRRETERLFSEYNIPSPSSEYWSSEFLSFARILKQQEHLLTEGKENLISKVRANVIQTRQRVHALISDS